MYLEVHEVH